MTRSDALSRFAQDELARMPALLDAVLVSTVQALNHPPAELPPAQRLVAADVARLAAAQRPRMVAAYTASLREHLQGPGAAVVSPPARSARGKTSLALVEEDAVVSDVEIHRAADVIRTAAEHELRELATFLSTLAGATHVLQDHNPLGPDVHAQALWAAALLLTPDGNVRSIFMRQAAAPLGAALRKACAAACTRLEDGGVTPAAYRTVVLHNGLRFDTPTSAAEIGTLSDAANRLANLLQRAQEMPVTATQNASPAPLQQGFTPAAATFSSPASGPNPPNRTADPQETLETLFDALLTRSGLAEDFKPAVACLLKPAVRLVEHETWMLQDPEHAVWRLVDRIAWQAELMPLAPHRERVRTAQVIDGLANQLARSADPNAALFEWAIERVLVLERNRFERLVARHARHSAALAATEMQLLAARGTEASDHGALDIGQLPTVPAELFDTVAMPIDTMSPAERWIDSVRAGDVVRLLLQGRWVQAQLLWCGRRREISLWADCTSDRTWPIRRAALRLLRQEDRALPVVPAQLFDTLQS